MMQTANRGWVLVTGYWMLASQLSHFAISALFPESRISAFPFQLSTFAISAFNFRHSSFQLSPFQLSTFAISAFNFRHFSFIPSIQIISDLASRFREAAARDAGPWP
jgi:hypothetical protein